MSDQQTDSSQEPEGSLHSSSVPLAGSDTSPHDLKPDAATACESAQPLAASMPDRDKPASFLTRIQNIPASSWSDPLTISLGADLKALALMRILVALSMVADLLCRWKDVPLLLSDLGAFPRSLMYQHSPASFTPTVYLMCGSVSATYLMFTLHILAGLALLVGYRTRWASLVCFILTVSLQFRNPWTVLGADQLIRLVLIHGVFLPWGKVWSMDAQANKSDNLPASTRVLSPIIASWKLQLAMVYIFAGFAKYGNFWDNGTAVELALQADGYSCEMGLRLVNWAQRQDGLLPALTHAVGPIEIALGLTLIAPWKRLQGLGFVALTAMHLVFNLSLSLGFFGLHSVAALVCIVPFENETKTEKPTVLLSHWQRQPGEWLLMGVLTITALIWNVQSIWPSFRRPFKGIKAITAPLGLQQGWNMFSPPPVEGGYAAVLACTGQGRWVNLLAPSPKEFETRDECALWDKTVGDYYQNRQRHLFFDRMTRKTQGGPEVWREIINATVRQWELEHPDWQQRIVEADLVRFDRHYRANLGYTPMVTRQMHRVQFE